MLVFEYEVTKCVKPEAFRTEQVSEPKPSEEVRKPRRKVVPRDERLPFFRTMFRLHRWLLGNRPQPGGGAGAYTGARWWWVSARCCL